MMGVVMIDSSMMVYNVVLDWVILLILVRFFGVVLFDRVRLVLIMVYL